MVRARAICDPHCTVGHRRTGERRGSDLRERREGVEQPVDRSHDRARVLEAARAFDAEVIESGDRHLLDLGTWSEIEIISPAKFIARWSA